MLTQKENLYPLLFEPIYKDVMWGGDMLSSRLKRDLPRREAPIGESWEIVDRDDDKSIVSNGRLSGTTITELLAEFGKEIIGPNYEGGPFPLLIKIIDAGKRLSLQVHPDELACEKIGEGAEPKTEMWYIIDSKKDAKIIAGLQPRATRRQFEDTVNSPEVENSLQIFDSASGDAYFINSGRIHAIGAGNLLLEIQQNSNTTYRVSDWGRVGVDGKSRELHVEKAMKCIDFMDRTSPIITGVSDSTNHNRKFPIINKCPFFKVDDLRLVETYMDNTNSTASFHLITAINNPVAVGKGDSQVEIPIGMTCLIPAVYGAYEVSIIDGSETTVVKTTL